MSNGYSNELRERVLSYYDQNKATQAEVCEIFSISLRAMSQWIRLRKETGDFSLKERPKTRKARKIDKEALKAYIEKHPDHYLWEIGEYFQAAASSVFNALKRLGIHRKKNYPLQREMRRKKTEISAGNKENIS
jgi:transposase